MLWACLCNYGVLGAAGLGERTWGRQVEQENNRVVLARL